MNFKTFFQSDDGATTVEYAVMLALVLAMVISAISVFGSRSDQAWGNLSAALENEMEN